MYTHDHYLAIVTWAEENNIRVHSPDGSNLYVIFFLDRGVDYLQFYQPTLEYFIEQVLLGPDPESPIVEALTSRVLAHRRVA